MKHLSKHITIILLALALTCFTSSVSYAKTFGQESAGAQVGLVTASVLTSAVYSPLKFVYAATGTLVSGIDLGLTAGKETASATRIARSSVNGDWYVNPDVFLGSKQLHFSGA